MVKEFSRMPYERVKDIVRLALRLQAARGGLTLQDIQDDSAISRSTAERMRGAVSEVFVGLERVDTGDAMHHWRLRSDAVRRLVAIALKNILFPIVFLMGAVKCSVPIARHAARLLCGFEEDARKLKETIAGETELPGRRLEQSES